MRHNRAHGSWRTIRHTKQLLAYLVVVLFMFMVYFPFYWIVCTSLKDFHALYDQEHLFWPEKISFENYHLLLTKTRFLDWMINSVIVSVSSTCISIVAGCLGAYALVRLKFRGQDFISSSILITYLVPPSILFIPLYYTLKQFHLANNLMGLIVAYPTFAIPFCTWLLMGFFKTIPVELDDAALIDGCTRFQAFYRIVLPLTGPGIVAVALFAWTFAWNEFLYALVFISSEPLKTLPVGISELIMGDVYLWGQLMAASVLTTLPIILVYMYLHRYMVAGLTAGSVKG